MSYNQVYPGSGLKVPRKIRQLKSDLKKAGFVERSGRGKGSHTFWVHPKHTGVSVTVAGHDGDDAQGYQEKQVREAIALAQSADESQSKYVMENRRHIYDKVSAEELAEARHYAMEIEWSPDDEVFVVSFPDAPGVMTHGATREEAAAMGEDAIITWLTALHDANIPVPPPTMTASQVRTAPPKRIPPERIREIRRGLDMSQRVFADVLNVSLATVRSWEQGVRTPDGASMRLLSIAERHPETIIEAASVSAGSRERHPIRP